MPSKDFYIKDKRYYEFNENLVFFDSRFGILRLRKIDDNLNFDPNGHYSVSGTVIFPNFRADNITELFSFEEFQSDYSSGTIDYQLSNDNGSTWFYVSSSGTWTQTTSGFSNYLDVSGNMGYFPLNYPKQVRVKARLSSVESRLRTPELIGLTINYEHDADLVEDMERSLKRFLTQRFIYKNESRFKIASGTSDYSVRVSEGGQLYNAESAYNITSDPNRRTNIIIGFNNSGNVSIVPQISGTLVIKHKNTVPVILDSDFDVDESKKDCIIIERLRNPEKKNLRTGDDVTEICKSRMIARVRPTPEYQDVDFNIRCQHGHHKTSSQITDGIQKILSTQKVIQSIGNGQDYGIRVYEPVSAVEYTMFSNLVRITISGYNDVVKFDNLANPSGSELPDEFTYIGSGIENRFDVIPLIKESGIIFNVRNI